MFAGTALVTFMLFFKQGMVDSFETWTKEGIVLELILFVLQVVVGGLLLGWFAGSFVPLSPLSARRGFVLTLPLLTLGLQATS